MNRWVKGTSLVLVAAALSGVVAVVVGKHLGERKMARRIPLAVAAVGPPVGAYIEHGRYLYNTRGCATCHGVDGGGGEVIRSRSMLVVAPNITAGANSATGAYQPVDWVRTLRHGVKPDGRPVMIMPSEDYSRLPDADIAALIGFVGQLPPVNGQRAHIALPVMVKVMYGFGQVRDAAELIDHRLPPAEAVPPALTLAHGAYVAHSCIGCHGANFSGGRIPGAPMDWPTPANLTPGEGSVMGRYPTAESFMAMLRSGRRPDGSMISPVMPYAALSAMTELDQRALHAYLKTLPARPAGQR